jgi:hypothetical protein
MNGWLPFYCTKYCCRLVALQLQHNGAVYHMVFTQKPYAYILFANLAIHPLLFSPASLRYYHYVLLRYHHYVLLRYHHCVLLRYRLLEPSED